MTRIAYVIRKGEWFLGANHEFRRFKSARLFNRHSDAQLCLDVVDKIRAGWDGAEIVQVNITLHE